jgi:hypothetical protein
MFMISSPLESDYSYEIRATWIVEKDLPIRKIQANDWRSNYHYDTPRDILTRYSSKAKFRSTRPILEILASLDSQTIRNTSRILETSKMSFPSTRNNRTLEGVSNVAIAYEAFQRYSSKLNSSFTGSISMILSPLVIALQVHSGKHPRI